MRPRQFAPAVITLLAMACAAIAPVSGCSAQTRYRVLSALFEEVPKPGEEVQPKPVVHPPRRPPFKPAPPAAAVEAAPAPEPERPRERNWRERLFQLPKDAAGEVDWVRALQNQLIQPRAGLDPEAKDAPVFSLDVELTPAGQPLFKATFPHQAHTEWLTCANCHPAIFQMQRGADPITMAKIYAGEYCGRCHGKVAFAVPTGCPRCHLALAGPK